MSAPCAHYEIAHLDFSLVLHQALDLAHIGRASREPDAIAYERAVRECKQPPIGKHHDGQEL